MKNSADMHTVSDAFEIGEELELKGKVFVLHAIRKKQIVLKLAPLHRQPNNKEEHFEDRQI